MHFLLAHNAYAKPSGEEHAAQAIGRLLEQYGHHVRWFWKSSADISPGRGQLRAFFSGIHSRRARSGPSPPNCNAVQSILSRSRISTPALSVHPDGLPPTRNTGGHAVP